MDRGGIALRGGGGGLEHLNSTLLSSARSPEAPTPGLRWLAFASHEFFHAINVKRLRPVELGPFDYDSVPRTPSPWISKGLTSYYGDLAVARAGLATREEFLSSVSAGIRNLQTSPGRLLLDAKIRRATDDASGLDDVMRLACARFSGERGFTPDQFQATTSETAGIDLEPFFHRALATTDEPDYGEILDWFGLRFAEPGSTDAARAWAFEVQPRATDVQTRHLQSQLASST